MNQGWKGQGPGAKGQGFRALLAWQRAHELALATFRSTQPLANRHGWLVRQCSRAAVSVPANIAEGYSRESLRDYLRYLQIARGSLAEVEYYLLFMRETELISTDVCAELESIRGETGRILMGLIWSLKAKEAVRRTRVGEEAAAYDGSDDDDRPGPWPLALGPAEPA